MVSKRMKPDQMDQEAGESKVRWLSLRFSPIREKIYRSARKCVQGQLAMVREPASRTGDLSS